MCVWVLVQTARFVLCQCRGIRWRLHSMLKAFTHNHSLTHLHTPSCSHGHIHILALCRCLCLSIRSEQFKTISFFRLFLYFHYSSRVIVRVRRALSLKTQKHYLCVQSGRSCESECDTFKYYSSICFNVSFVSLRL